MRVFFWKKDNLFNTCWFNVLDTKKGPAYLQLNKEQLAAILFWCDLIKEDASLAVLLNNNSLKWRTYDFKIRN